VGRTLARKNPVQKGLIGSNWGGEGSRGVRGNHFENIIDLSGKEISRCGCAVVLPWSKREIGQIMKLVPKGKRVSEVLEERILVVAVVYCWVPKSWFRFWSEIM